MRHALLKHSIAVLFAGALHTAAAQTASPPIAPVPAPQGMPAATESAPAIAPVAPGAQTYDRHQRGLETLEKITGGGTAKLIDSLKDIAPELGDWIIDFAYGDVVARPQLPLQTRELVTVGALTALGNAQPQLKAHIKGALNAGCTPREVVEVILQMAVYGGFPTALNGLTAAREVFAERQISVSR